MKKCLAFLLTFYIPANTFACISSETGISGLLKLPVLPIVPFSDYFQFIALIFLTLSVYFLIVSFKKNTLRNRLISEISFIVFLLFSFYLITISTSGIGTGCGRMPNFTQPI